MKQYPGVKLNVFYKPMAELMDMLRRRQVDFVLAFKPSETMEGIESHVLFQNYLAAIANPSHPIAGLPKVRIEDVARYSLALPSKGLQARNALDTLLERNPCELKIRIELNDPHILLDLIRRSTLVTVLAGVKAIPLDVPGGEMSGCVHILKDSYRKRSMQVFITLLSESMAVRERANAWI